jgi:hypothetical protein
MTKTLTRIFSVLVLAVACHAQQTKAEMFYTGSLPNGLYWALLDNDKKLALVDGIRMGAIVSLVPEAAGTLPSCAGVSIDTVVRAWEGVSAIAVIPSVDTFYDTAAVNIPVPIAFVVVYRVMELHGASKADLDRYRKTMYELIRNAANTAK